MTGSPSTAAPAAQTSAAQTAAGPPTDPATEGAPCATDSAVAGRKRSRAQATATDNVASVGGDGDGDGDGEGDAGGDGADSGRSSGRSASSHSEQPPRQRRQTQLCGPQAGGRRAGDQTDKGRAPLPLLGVLHPSAAAAIAVARSAAVGCSVHAADAAATAAATATGAGVVASAARGRRHMGGGGPAGGLLVEERVAGQAGSEASKRAARAVVVARRVAQVLACAPSKRSVEERFLLGVVQGAAIDGFTAPPSLVPAGAPGRADRADACAKEDQSQPQQQQQRQEQQGQQDEVHLEPAIAYEVAPFVMGQRAVPGGGASEVGVRPLPRQRVWRWDRHALQRAVRFPLVGEGTNGSGSAHVDDAGTTAAASTAADTAADTKAPEKLNKPVERKRARRGPPKPPVGATARVGALSLEPLPPDCVAFIKGLPTGRQSETVLFQVPGVHGSMTDITAGDLRRLSDTAMWLNDNVINAYVGLMNTRVRRGDASSSSTKDKVATVKGPDTGRRGGRLGSPGGASEHAGQEARGGVGDAAGQVKPVHAPPVAQEGSQPPRETGDATPTTGPEACEDRVAFLVSDGTEVATHPAHGDGKMNKEPHAAGPSVAAAGDAAAVEEPIHKRRLDPAQSHCWGTFFFTTLTGGDPHGAATDHQQSVVRGDHARVSRWTRGAGVDVCALHSILVPIHEGGNHWCLAQIDPVRRCVRFFNSFRSRHVRPGVLSVLYQWYRDEVAVVAAAAAAAAKSNVADARLDGCDDGCDGGDARAGAAAAATRAAAEAARVADETCWDGIVVRRGLPYQTDGSSCGVFMLLFADCLSLGVPIPPVVGAEALANLRLRMALDLLIGKLYC